MMLETAISKLFCSEGLWQIADDALQIWGGEGYMREHGIERMRPRRRASTASSKARLK